MSRRALRAEAGFAAFAVLLLVLGLGAASMLLAIETRSAGLLKGTRSDVLTRRLDGMADAVQAYYRATADRMDVADAAPIDCPGLLSAANAVDAPELIAIGRMQCVIGARQRTPDGWLAHRSIWLWLAPEDQPDTSVYDAATDTLAPAAGAVWRHVDGRAVQLARLSDSLDRMDQLVDHLKRYYLARTAAAGSLDAGANFWVLAPCAGVDTPAPAGAPACTQGLYVAAAPVLAVTGLPAGIGSDAWGGPFEFRNSGAGVSASVPPYSARLRMTTPWGFVIERDLALPL